MPDKKTALDLSILNVFLYLIIIVGLLALAQKGLNKYYLRVLSTLAIYIVLTVSLNLTNGFSGDFSLGHAAFMSIGAYVSALLTLPVAKKTMMIPDLPAWLNKLTLPSVIGTFIGGAGEEGALGFQLGVLLGFLAATIIGGLMASLIALVVGVPVLRLRGHYLAVATLGLMVIVRVVANQWIALTRGAKGINGMPRYTSNWWAYAWALLTIYVVWRIINSPYGRAMMAIREDETAAAVRGVNVTRHRLLAFIVGAFFAGVGGVLWGHQITAITPSSFWFSMTFNVVVMLVVGGSGSISGSVLGAAFMYLVPELFLRKIETYGPLVSLVGHPLYGLSQIIIAIAITLVMIFRREGLLGGREISLPRLFRARPRPAKAEA